MARRRLLGEPVMRILGQKAFYGLDFILGPATLEPRPETEMLVRRGLELLEGRTTPRLLDLGTGTGCIAIALLHENQSALAVAVDLAPEALATAQANADRHGVDKRLSLKRGSWFEPLMPGEQFDIIVSNPPYIASEEMATLSREVREHDPVLALDGGPDGLAPYRAILGQAARWLKPDGAILCEIGSTQGFAVQSLFFQAGLRDVVVHPDLAGHDRMVEGHHI